MATKSKKFKHTFFAKGICFLLSLLFFFGGAFYGIRLILACVLFGVDEYFADNVNGFTSISSFADRLSTDANRLVSLAGSNKKALDELQSKQNTVTDEAVNGYLDKKAAIIKAELEYAVNNYDESYFNYEYSADAVTMPVTTEENTTSLQSTAEVTTIGDVSENITKPIIDEKAPKNIQLAQQILESVTGRDFLNYEALVRSDAFAIDYAYTIDLQKLLGSDDTTNIIDNSMETAFNFHMEEMRLSESQMRRSVLSAYNDYVQTMTAEYTSALGIRAANLEQLENLKYYTVSKDGTIYTNMTDTPTAESVAAHSIYAYYDGSAAFTKGLDAHRLKNNISAALSSAGDSPIYIYFEEINANGEFDSSDIYALMLNGYNDLHDTSMATAITSTVIFAALALIFLVALLCLCGHKNGYAVPVTAFIDKVPNDVHTVLSFGVIAGIVTMSIFVLNETLSDIAYVFTDAFPQIFALTAVVCYAVLIEWLASVVRVKKAKNSWFKYTLIGKVCIGIKKFIFRLASAMAYKPKKLKRIVLLLTVVYTLGNFLIFLLGWLSPLFIILSLLYNAGCLLAIHKYVTMLDSIIDASCRHENIQLDAKKTPKSLKLLAENLTNTNAELEKAVEKAVKDEQTKTELITNVSHDLKTPLTSLITYSDILKKCNITDPQALKYIDVINAQSIKLKRLIEDLIEASKVSTGNVTLNKSILNLSEIAAQAIVEFEPEMEKNGNEIRFSEPETAPTIYADGSKTYRVITNLLSNAKKYSAPDTRVYIAIYNDDHHGYFEIKNISCEPLNISPDELTERFVRGDKSRAREGNGLGLSIAKDLCELQGGELKIIIDGDLFKAIVQLPSRGAAEESGFITTANEQTAPAYRPDANFVSTESDA